MADNTVLPVGSGGDTIGTDDIGGVKFQRMKLIHGADGVNAGDVATGNPLPIALTNNGLVSTVNSTATVLTIGAAFTGTSEDITEYSDIRVSVFADQVSATDGLQMQQSSNGTNWDISDAYTIPASSGKTFSVGVSAKFFRIVYTNGGVASTAFRLQTKYYKGYTKGSSVRPQDARGNDNDMEEQLSHLMAYNGTAWDRARHTVANGLSVDVTRVQATVSVVGTRPNSGVGVVSGSQHLTVGGSDGTNLRPMSVDTTGRSNTNTILAAETTKVIGTVNVAAAQTLATVSAVTAITNALPTGANTIGAVTGPAAAPLSLDATQTNHTQRLQSVTSLTTISAANTTITLTLPAVAAQFHYITRIEIVRVATAALAGTAVLSYTSSNIPGAWARSAGNAMTAGGTVKDVDESLVNPIKSTTVNTATTIVAPAAGAAVLVRITAYYYTTA